MNCKNCSEELPDYPQREVEDGDLNEVIMHKYTPDDAPSYVCSRTDYYCSIECIAEVSER